MIASVRGKLIYKSRGEAILEASGVGYHMFISGSAFEMLNEPGEEYQLLTFLDVKENSLQLYGFTDTREREIFKLLIGVSGIGPKLAHSFLSNLSFDEIVSAISSGGKGFPVRIPGLGQKKLELISMSLKDKIFRIAGGEAGFSDELKQRIDTDTSRLDALNALVNLGYQRSDAEKIIREVLKSSQGEKIGTEELIRKSFEYISK